LFNFFNFNSFLQPAQLFLFSIFFSQRSFLVSLFQKRTAQLMNDQDFVNAIECIYINITYFIPGGSVFRQKLAGVLSDIFPQYYNILLHFSNHRMGFSRHVKYDSLEKGNDEKVKEFDRMIFSEEKELLKVVEIISADLSVATTKISVADKFSTMKSLLDFSDFHKYEFKYCKKFANLYYLSRVKIILDKLFSEKSFSKEQESELQNNFTSLLQFFEKETGDKIYTQLFSPDKKSSEELVENLENILPTFPLALLKIISSYTILSNDDIDEVILSTTF
jgi:hypothetical protein